MCLLLFKTVSFSPLQINFKFCTINIFAHKNRKNPYKDSSKDGDYILEGSDSRYITEKEVENLSEAERRLAKNEIYARHGRMFDSADLQDYFESKSWYKGTVKPSDFDESVLNKYEKANIDLISSME